MTVTEPGDIANLTHDGKAATTDTTNAMAAEKGFPMELAAGGVVLIVQKREAAQQKTIFVAADGTEYIHSGDYHGPLIQADGVTDEPLEDATDTDDQVLAELEQQEAQRTDAPDTVTETVKEEQEEGQAGQQ